METEVLLCLTTTGRCGGEDWAHVRVWYVCMYVYTYGWCCAAGCVAVLCRIRGYSCYVEMSSQLHALSPPPDETSSRFPLDHAMPVSHADSQRISGRRSSRRGRIFKEVSFTALAGVEMSREGSLSRQSASECRVAGAGPWRWLFFVHDSHICWPPFRPPACRCMIHDS